MTHPAHTYPVRTNPAHSPSAHSRSGGAHPAAAPIGAAPRPAFPPLLDVADLDDEELRYWTRSVAALLCRPEPADQAAGRVRLTSELARLRAEHRRRNSAS